MCVCLIIMIYILCLRAIILSVGDFYFIVSLVFQKNDFSTKVGQPTIIVFIFIKVSKLKIILIFTK